MANLKFASQLFPKETKNVLSYHRGVSLIDSPYYYWFCFLQLNEDYELSVTGEKKIIDQHIVNDLGKVRGKEFIDWWQDHAALFAEPPDKNHTKAKIRVVDSQAKLS